MILRQDTRSKSVRDLQRNLWGADLRVDGSFGPKTKIALLQAQRLLGLPVTGTWDSRQELRLTPPQKLLPSSVSMFGYKIPYLSQRDNFYSPSGTCNLTCVAMILASLGVPIVREGKQLEDILFENIHKPEALEHFKAEYSWAVDAGIPPQQVWGMLEWLLKDNGVMSAEFSTHRTKADILVALEKGPVMVSTSFTKSGHIVLITGFTREEDLIVNDPWGDWTTNYKNTNGSHRVYPAEVVWPHIERKDSSDCWALTVSE